MVSTTRASTTSAPIVRRAETASEDSQVATQARALQARYAALAARPDALALALTGRRMAELPAQQQVRLLALSKSLVAGEVAWPQWRTAQAHPGAAQPSGGADALFEGAVAAFVPGQAGKPGTALLAHGLKGDAREAAIIEELGEALAHAAVQRGIEVGQGDRGARLAAAAGGRSAFAGDEFTARSDDNTVVRLDGRLVPALAKQALAKTPLNVHFPGARGFTLSMPVKGGTFKLKDGGKWDTDKGRGEITMKVDQNYTGTISILAPNGKKVGELNVIDYGGKGSSVIGMGSTTHVLRKSKKGNVFHVEPRHKPAKSAAATLQLDNVFGYATFSINRKKYAVVDNNVGDVQTKLNKEGYQVLADASNEAGKVRFAGGVLRETSVIKNGVVVPSEDPNAVSWRFTASGIGTPNAKVTVKDFRGQPKPGTFVATTATPTINTNDAKNESTVSVLAQPAGNLLNVLDNAIDKVEISVASAIADMKAFRFSNDYRSMSADIGALQGLLFTHMGTVMKQFEKASQAFATNKDAFFTPAQIKTFDSRFAKLRELVEGEMMDVAQGMLHNVADKAVNNAGAFYDEMKDARASRILDVVNSVMGIAFLGLGWANGMKAYLPTVVAGHSKGEVDSLGLWLARGAVYSGAGAAAPQIAGMEKRNKEYYAKTQSPSGAGLPEGQAAWDTLTAGLEKMPIVQRLRSMLVKFQVDVATAGPHLHGDPRVPGGKNPAWDDKLGYVKTIGQISNGQDGTQFKHWRFRDDTKWLGDFATGLAKDQPFLFENSAKGGMKGAGGTMKGARVAAHLPAFMPLEAIGVFTRERPKHDNLVVGTGEARGERLELKVVLPWMGVR